MAAISYLVQLLTAFLAPDFSKQVFGILSILPIIAEVWMLGYLLVVGVKTEKADNRILAAAKA